MKDLHFKFSLSEKEIQTLAKLINTNLEFDKFSSSHIKHLIFDDPNFSTEYIICGYKKDKLISFLCGVQANYKGKQIGWIKIFLVDKKFRRKGIGRQMFSLIEEKFKSCDEIRIMDSVPCYFQPGVDVRYTEAIVFLESLGYKKIGENIHLETDLTKIDFSLIKILEQQINQQNYRIVRGTTELYQPLVTWIQQIFPAWEYEVSFSYKAKQPQVFIALHNDKVVGFSCFNTTAEGWFGPIGVDPQHRKVGLGKILLLKSLKELKNLGYKKSVIPWISPSSLKFYVSTCNARISRCFWVYTK
jgi:GNAT superfamily N-acetyltransferase